MLGHIYLGLSEILLRAGGGSGGGRSSGGGFSGGGSSGGGFSFGGSSSSSSSGSVGELGGAAAALIFGGIGVFVVFIVLSAVLKSVRGLPTQAGEMVGLPSNFGQANTMLGNADSARVKSKAELDAGIAKIKAHDPQFNEDDFLSDVNRAFFTIQQAWTERKPDLSRQVMHDGVWNQHKFQIDQYISQNKQNVLENLAIQNTRMVAADSDESFDTIVVRYFASCADYDIDLSSEKRKVVRGSKNIEDWAEDWVYQRSSRAVTKPNEGTMNQKCPNCGAPLDLDLSGICKYCKAPVMSGEFDWVLTRIEQLPSYEWAQQTLPR